MATGQRKVGYFTKLDPQLRQAMRQFKQNTGVPEAQQIDRALREWLAERADAWPLPKPATKKTGRKRRASRRRP